MDLGSALRDCDKCIELKPDFPRAYARKANVQLLCKQVCMYACVCVCVCTWICLALMQGRLMYHYFASRYVCMYMCMYVCVCVYVDLPRAYARKANVQLLCKQVCMHVYVYVCVCVCVRGFPTCMYACMYQACILVSPDLKSRHIHTHFHIYIHTHHKCTKNR